MGSWLYSSTEATWISFVKVQYNGSCFLECRTEEFRNVCFNGGIQICCSIDPKLRETKYHHFVFVTELQYYDQYSEGQISQKNFQKKKRILQKNNVCTPKKCIIPGSQFIRDIQICRNVDSQKTKEIKICRNVHLIRAGLVYAEMQRVR